MLERFYLKAPH